VIVADTGAMVALIDEDDAHHATIRALWQRDPYAWVLPWAILAEVDYLLLKHVGPRAERLFVQDVADGRFFVEWHNARDLARARELNDRYAALELGLVDAVVMACAERLRARAIATLDLHDFGAVELAGAPRLLPRDEV
jgi:uncharacterized protein